MLRKWMCLLILVFTAIGVSAASEVQEGPEGSLASTVPPAYPLAAKAAGIEGKVIIKGVIGTDGKMRNIRAVKGPIELQQAAIDTVSRWVYHPYTHNGTLVEVDTTVTVNFSMGSKKKKAAAQAAAQEALARAAAEESHPSVTPRVDR